MSTSLLETILPIEAALGPTQILGLEVLVAREANVEQSFHFFEDDKQRQ